ncbi:MAG: hypothetical protein QXH08_00700, partial [Candidatus Hadarchaeales archaeon]
KMVLMDILQAFGAITLPIIVTVILSNRQTQRIIETTTAQTHQILSEIKKVQEDISCTLKKVRRIQQDTTCLLKKVDLGLRANAVMHGWKRVDGLTPEEARKLPEPKVYDEELKICYHKS